MLNIFRQGGFVKSIMGGVVILLIAAFMFDYRGKSPSLETECVAQVDKECIEPKDFDALLRLVGPSGASTKELKKTGFLKHSVDALVERELLLREAKRLGLGVSETAVDDELALGRVHYSWPVDAPIPRALMQGMSYPRMGANEGVTYIRVRNSKTEAFDFALYRRQLQQLLRMSPKEFKQQQTAEITAARVRELITSSVRVAPEEAFFVYEQQRSTVTARFVDAKAAWFGRFAIDTSEAAGQQFLAANGPLVDAAWEPLKAKWVNGCPLVSEILFQYPVGADAEAQAQVQERAHQAQQLLKDGASFESVARAFSDGDQARLGGALGCLSEAYGPAHEDLAKAVSTLNVGQRTQTAIETPKGLHLLKLDGKLAAADIERLGKLYVARGVAADKAQLERAQTFGKALVAAVEGGKGLKEAMDELVSAEIVFDKAKSSDPAKRNIAEKLLSAALASELAPRFDISRAVARGTSPLPGLVDGSVTGKLLALSKDDAILPEVLNTPGGVVVLQLKEKDVATRESFEKDKERALESLLEQKRTEALSAYVEKLRSATKKINISQKYTSGAELPTNDPSDG